MLESEHEPSTSRCIGGFRSWFAAELATSWPAGRPRFDINVFSYDPVQGRSTGPCERERRREQNRGMLSGTQPRNLGIPRSTALKLGIPSIAKTKITLAPTTYNICTCLEPLTLLRFTEILRRRRPHPFLPVAAPSREGTSSSSRHPRSSSLLVRRLPCSVPY